MHGGGGNLDISILSHRVINTIQQRHRTTASRVSKSVTLTYAHNTQHTTQTT
jgi:hypothetical protein